MERIILHKALSYYFGTDAFSIMPKDNDFIIEKDNKRYFLSELDITEQYRQAEYEYLDIQAKIKRNKLLKECDWIVLPDVINPKKEEWILYRQYLRDITEQENYPYEINWGEKPE